MATISRYRDRMAVRLERLAPLTGVGFIILLVGGLIVGGATPDIDAPTSEIDTFWQDNSTRQQASALLVGLAALFLLWFGGSLRRAISRAEGGDGRLAALAFGGTIIATVGLLLLATMAFALADTADHVPPDVVHTIHVLSYDVFLPLIGGAVGLLVAAGLAFIRTAVLPRWLGWVAFVLAVAILTPLAFFGLVAWLLWIAAVSILLYLGESADLGRVSPSP
jgi:hypothetical protein